jgi:hypothetical protein
MIDGGIVDGMIIRNIRERKKLRRIMEEMKDITKIDFSWRILKGGIIEGVH